MIRLRAASASRAFDGQPLLSPGFSLSILPPGSLEAERKPDGSYLLSTGDVLQAELSGSQTEVGSSQSSFASVIIWRGQTDVTYLYKLILVDGLLEILLNTDS